MKYPDDFINKIICGDCLEVMKKMPYGSVDMIMTSPPYWGLRDYGTGPDQLGLEPTPELYIEHLTEILNEAKRVLKKQGTLWLNMGDTYGGSSCGRHDYREEGSISPMVLFSDKDNPQQKIMPKCLLMIPERLSWSLIQNGWILRNKIIWFKPNSMPSSAQDRFSNRWEYIFLFSKSGKYYFDLDAIREPHHEDSIERKKRGVGPGHKYADLPDYGGGGGLNKPRISLKDKRKGLNVPGQAPHGMHRKRHSGYFGEDGEYLVNPLGKNPGDHWKISTVGFPDAHFAVFPEKLCEKPIKAGCPEEICRKCGKARERISKASIEMPEQEKKFNVNPINGKDMNHPSNRIRQFSGKTYVYPDRTTIGWTSCKCKAGFESGIVLDPFAGAGTALYVAKQLRRRFIGIEIKKEYCNLCEKRLAQGVL